MKVTMCDPPSGWKYGFPKAMPSECKNPDFDLQSWLISCGYPKELIDSFGDHFYCRFWNEEYKIVDYVQIADDATMAIPYHPKYDDLGSLTHIIRYSDDINNIRFTIASIIDSYDYLLSDNITMQEATRRLRILRKKNKENKKNA